MLLYVISVDIPRSWQRLRNGWYTMEGESEFPMSVQVALILLTLHNSCLSLNIHIELQLHTMTIVVGSFASCVNVLFQWMTKLQRSERYHAYTYCCSELRISKIASPSSIQRATNQRKSCCARERCSSTEQGCGYSCRCAGCKGFCNYSFACCM